MAIDQYQVLLAAVRSVTALHDRDARNEELAEAIAALIDVKIAVALDALPKKNWPISMDNA